MTPDIALPPVELPALIAPAPFLSFQAQSLGELERLEAAAFQLLAVDNEEATGVTAPAALPPPNTESAGELGNTAATCTGELPKMLTPVV